ncbi:hypothetical protein [Streptosporangium carneum]|uniref:Lipoprotein n=1 Tax=Streptosporangium carneum TaxID=47481 RepID=A0A9W6MA53_9ACTN|nr:hypothetical protein [Streptosporangium carneum]GLK06642.1 hypothetical protein GCM10017600_00470 [Streptosporangium carneum]
MRHRFSFVAAALALTALGCDVGPVSPNGAGGARQDSAAHEGKEGAKPYPVERLRRPWAVERLQPGAPCPVTTTTTRPDQALGPVQGGWLAGPVGLGADGRLEYTAPGSGSRLADPTWAAQKVMWAVNPTLTTPVLVRGRRLDGPGVLGFDDPAVEELLLDPAEDALPGGWRDRPSLTRLRAPGCYAYQVDAAAGSFTIVFRAAGPAMRLAHD